MVMAQLQPNSGNAQLQPSPSPAHFAGPLFFSSSALCFFVHYYFIILLVCLFIFLCVASLSCYRLFSDVPSALGASTFFPEESSLLVIADIGVACFVAPICAGFGCAERECDGSARVCGLGGQGCSRGWICCRGGRREGREAERGLPCTRNSSSISICSSACVCEC